MSLLHLSAIHGPSSGNTYYLGRPLHCKLPCTQGTKTLNTTKENDTLKRNTETIAKKDRIKYPTTQIKNNNNNNNNDVPMGTKDKVQSTNGMRAFQKD
jgi:hypothetical protein